MIKKLTLITCIFLVFISTNAQSSEGRVFEIAQRIKIFLPEINSAVLEGTGRYIHIGFLGNENDVQDLVGYMDRFMIDGKDMTLNVDASVREEEIDYYKFYLDPLYDANNFQKMLEMFKIEKYNIGRTEYPVNTFSNKILAFIKTKK